MANSPDRPTYTQEQLGRYYDRLKFPEGKRKFNIKNESPAAALEHLGLLQKYQLTAVPFENLMLHYSYHRQVTLDPEELFRKTVENGRGGYCMENNLIFGTVLKSLGYNMYAGGARVSLGGFNGWDHMVNLVTIDGMKYVVDVGFGSNCIVSPLPLRDGPVYDNIKPAAARLVFRNIEPNTDPNQRLWVYEHRISETHDWVTMYCFTELEFLPQDFKIMNYYTSTNPKMFFTQQVVCAKMVMDEHEELIGSVILQTNLKRRLHGGNKMEEVFANEEARVRAIEKEFGISLNSTEREAIKGMVSEVKPELDFS